MNKYLYLIIWVIACMLASCSTTRQVNRVETSEQLKATTLITSLASHSSDFTAFTAKMNLTLGKEDKGGTKVSGTFRIKRDESIQLSVSPILGIEVAKLEITPTYFLVIDRIHKEYMRIDYEALSSLFNLPVDYKVLQSLFLNEVFLPGKETVKSSDLKSFRISQSGDTFMADLKAHKMLQCNFMGSMSQQCLSSSYLGLRNTNYALNWEYDNFSPFEYGSFPMQMRLQVLGFESPFSLKIDFSKLTINSDWESTTEISKKYKKVPFSELIKRLTLK